MKIEIKISNDNKRAVELAIEFIETRANRSASNDAVARQRYVSKAINLLPHAVEVKKFGELDHTRSYIPNICGRYIDKCTSYRSKRNIAPDLYIKQAIKILKSVRSLYDYADFEQLEFM